MNRYQKWWQRWILDSLIMNPPPLFVLFCAVFGCVFAVGFLCAHFIDEVDLANYRPYDVLSDNIGGVKIDSITKFLPVDAVYTWVNGSDPAMLESLRNLEKDDLINCCHHNCYPSEYASIFLGNKIDSKSLQSIVELVHVVTAKGHQIGLIRLERNEDFNGFKNRILSNFRKDISVSRAYWTSEEKVDWSVEWKTATILKLAPFDDLHSEISNISPENYDKIFQICSFTKHKNTYIMECSEETIINKLKVAINEYAKKSNLRYPKILAANLILRINQTTDDHEINRFYDNEELRYSFRSLEKYAPWIRKVFIVTNGQIPYWLNLDNPKLTIITHDQIFTNLSHLPTYSSPAIESHIHRIPGLSNNFIYLNDDVMLGAPVWPEDFYSPSTGYKIYLSWSLPECSSGCPGSWINDGYCDLACNNSACNFDGGDCPGDIEDKPMDYFDKMEDEMDELEYCSTTCADNWLYDSYCDTACDVDVCGFDIGDCGEENIRKNLYQIPFNSKENKTLVLPKGVMAAWVDLSAYIKEMGHATVEGNYSRIKGVRVAAVNNNFGFLILVFKLNYTEIIGVDLNFNKKLNDEQESNVKIKLTLQFNTYSNSSSTSSIKINSTTNIQKFDINHKIEKAVDRKLKNEFNLTTINKFKLPSKVSESLAELKKELDTNILTQKGYNIKRKMIFDSFLNAKKKPFKKEIDNWKLNQTNTYFNRQLLSSKNNFYGDITLGSYRGHFPWERHKKNSDFLVNKLVRNGNQIVNSNNRNYAFGRKLLDTYAESLLFVNRLYNSEYGVQSRRVPAHIPHFIDKKILQELHEKFFDEFYVTSSHRLRQGNDMQFALSYFYFLMSETRMKNFSEIFAEFDTDMSGTWSDREIRTFLVKTNDLPLSYKMIMDLHNDLRNCSEKYETHFVATSPYERYADSKLPTVSEELVVKCSESILAPRLKPLQTVSKFSYTVTSDTVAHFIMVSSNLSTVIHHLDNVRKNRRKFICFNSDLSPDGKDNDLIRALIQDTYESLYPIPSSFELPLNYRNRFLYTWDVEQWKRWRNLLRAFIYASIVCFIILIVMTFFKDEIESIKRRWCRRRRRKAKLLGMKA